MLQLFIGLLGILLTIFFIVGIHELGHFIVARWVGVKVLRFSIGFGKALYRWYDKKGTEYVLAAIPLGGYVKMVDENEENVAKEDLPFAFNRQPVYKKFLIAIAGPISNFIFAFFIYWLLLLIGFTSIVPLIGKITPNSIAAQAGMQPQQEILTVNHKNMNSWDDILINLLLHAGNKDKIHITTKNMDTQKNYQYNLNTTNWRMNELKPDPLSSLGIIPFEPTIAPVVGNLLANSAAKDKLQVGDKILTINNKPIKDWFDMSNIIESHPDQNITVKFERSGKIFTTEIKTHYQRDLLFHKHGVIGISPKFEFPKKLLKENKPGFLPAIPQAWETTYDFIYLNFLVLGKLITGKISLASLGGPITIFQSAGTALNTGIVPFLGFLAFLSIAIGFLNILPIPGLDGGHILFQVIELIIRRPVPLNVQLLFYRLGFIILILLITQALVNDLLRLSK